MSFDVGTVVSEAADRFATAAGAAVFVALAAASLVQLVAEQDAMRAFLAWLEGPVLDAFREEDPQQAAEFAATIDQAQSNVVLALGLPWEVAALLWLVGFVIAAAVVAVALDAFGFGRDRLTGIEVRGLGRKTFHLAVGWLVYALAVFVGLMLFVLPGLVVLVFLAYFPAAVALDDEGFLSAYGTSVSVVREHLGSTILVVLIAIGAMLGAGIVGGAISTVLEGAAGPVLEELVGTVATVFVLALLARAYLAGTREEADVVGEEEPVHEEW